MSRLAISNLALPTIPVERIAPQLVSAGIDGVEVAPTVVWPEAPLVPTAEVRAYTKRWREYGIALSGIQSLLFGHPEMQVFDKQTWQVMHEHLVAMIRLAHDLDADIAVFGSPRNRVRGDLGDETANAIFAEFLYSLLPVLEDCGIVLTLEPNAPAYGADYLIHYAETVTLSDLVASPWVQPQVDTGCLFMVNDAPEHALRERRPAHLHISTPNLMPPPGSLDHVALRNALETTGYDGWIVLEMLQATTKPLQTAIESARWLVDTYG